MARKVDSFENANTVRRYPWKDWTDGAIWEIVRHEDYDVPTENMRVNLHERAKFQSQKVKTAIVRESDWEGLRFQFIGTPIIPAGSLARALNARARMTDWKHPVNDPRRFS